MQPMRLTNLLFPLLAAACGAPHKTAGEVKEVFAESGGLNTKLSDSCRAFQQGNMAKTAGRLKFSLASCSTNAGVYAVELAKSDLYFHPEPGGTPASANAETFTVINRSQVWLNHSLLDMAAIVLKKIRERGPNTTPIDGRVIAEYKFDELLTIKINFVGEPTLDQVKLQFSQKIRVVSTGLAETDVTAQLDAALVDGHLIGLVTTSNATTNSFLKDVSASIVVIPHDGDIYVDSYVSLELFNLGYTTVLKRVISSLLGSGINTIIQEIKELKEPAS